MERDVCAGLEAIPVPVCGPWEELGPFQSNCCQPDFSIQLVCSHTEEVLKDVPIFAQRSPCNLFENRLTAFRGCDYSPELVAGPGADPDPSEVTIQGCQCRGESCVAERCPCLPRGDNYVSRCVTLGRDTPILECNVLCGCAETCANRESQRGLQFHLEVCQIPGKGWGLRTKEEVPQGRFVCEYAGEVLGHAEACGRIKSQDPDANNYIIAVHEHFHGGRLLQTYVDPTRIGNVGRFLNHSCRPNLVMLPVRSHSVVPRLALFAARGIQAGEELCYDYSGRSFNAEPAQESQSMDMEGEEGAPGPRKRCLCAADICSGYLPFDSSLYRGDAQKSDHL